jgi:drug/metabolite transporter (DMT)-like permease
MQISDGYLIAILAGLGGMLGWGLADFFAKKTIDEVGDTVSLVWAHIFGTLVLLVFALYQAIGSEQRFILPNSLNAWMLLAFFGALQALVYILVYQGFGKGQVAVLSPIFASFSGLTALFSILVFKEVVTGDMFFFLFGIFIGVILLSTDFSALRERRFNFFHAAGSKEILLATLFAALWTLFWDRVVGGRDWVSYTLFMYVFMTVVLLIYAKWKKISLKITKSHVWKFLVLIGFCEVVAYLAISLGYSATQHTSVVALLSGAFSLPVIILARIFLKERVTKMQTLGSIIVIMGIVLLSLV